MNNKDIENIAYLLKQAKDKNKPKPIVFLGAGASASAGVPLTGKIISDILENFADNPTIKKLSETDKKDYYKVMGALETFERHDLLRSYIESPDVKINVTHIYLAQMLKEGYVDYVVTVNFDDLLLKACALYNFIPAVYDIAILKDFTTTTLQKRSVTYLHGQYHGLWLLNTPDELKKVKEEGNDSISNVFRQICNERTWIVAGYSGEDGILDKISKLGRFDNNLFWVGYKDNEPSKNVQDNLLNKPNSNAYWVSGYDSDSFFLKLHSELNLDTPEIFNKPFSFLKNVVNNIKDIENPENVSKEHKDLFKQVNERFSTSKKWIEDAVNRYENQSAESTLLDKEQIDKDDIKQEIVEAIIKEKFDNIELLATKITSFAPELNKNLADLYFNYAYKMQDLKNYDEAIRLYQKAISLNPIFSDAYINLGTVFIDVKEYDKAIENYQRALSFSEDATAYLNIGLAFDLKKNYDKAIEYYHKAISIKNNYENAYEALANSYALKKEFNQALKYYHVLHDLNPENFNLLTDIANTYSEIGEFEKANTYYKEATKNLPENSEIYVNWGFCLFKQGNISGAEEKLKKSIEIDNNAIGYMNLGHVYLSKNEEENAINNYKRSIDNFEDQEEFWKEMNEDFEYLTHYGITPEHYQIILNKIKED